MSRPNSLLCVCHSMSRSTNFAQIRRILRELYSVSRDNFAITFMMAILTIISPGCNAEPYNQADSSHAATQSTANSTPTKSPADLKSATNSQLYSNAFQSSRPADENTADIVTNSSGRSSVAVNGWQYCLAPSNADNKVYISPPFPKNADIAIAFGQMLLQVQHDDVQCPIAYDKGLVSIMRQHAISFNRNAGNTIINWEPPQFPHPGSENIHTGINGPKPNRRSAWQYCLAPSYEKKTVYISSAFPKSASLRTSEAFFGKMLFRSGIQHDAVQCPIGKDEASILSMREYAIGFNHDRGNKVITLNWKLSGSTAGIAIKAEDTP